MAANDLRNFLNTLGGSEEAQVAIGLLIRDAKLCAAQAKSAGFAVSEDDVVQLQREALLPEGAELSEGELELVSGGAWPKDRMPTLIEFIVEGTKENISNAAKFIAALPGNLVKGAQKDYQTIRGWLGG